MPRWSYVLGGLLVWTVHFSGLYAVASLEAETPASDEALWLSVAGALSLACATSCAALAAMAWRRLKRRGTGGMVMLDQLALLGAGLAFVAIAWQSVAILIA
jgi:hypothetical protein